MSDLQLCLQHELILLVLDDAKGSFTGTLYQYGLAGALLSELLLQGVIKVSLDDEKITTVAIAKTTGDEILDEVVKLISDSKKPKSLQHWVYTVACLPRLCQRVADQLCELEILEYNESKVLWMFTRKRYPEIDASFEDAIRKRMAEVMFTTGLKADQRTSVLIALAQTSGGLNANFAPVELRKHEARITEICDGKQLASGATVEAIAAVQACMTAITVATAIATTSAATS